MQPKTHSSLLLKSSLLFCLLTVYSLVIQAQQRDSLFHPRQANAELLRLAKKNIKIYHPDSLHKPATAFKRSGFIPGWGQFYNGKWWKVPLIYGGIGLLGSAVVYNQRNYEQYLAVYQLKRNPDLPLPNKGTPIRTLYDNTRTYDNAAIANALSGHQRNMQLSILGIASAWGLQMLDAYIDAKFIHSYTMDRNLSFNIKPGINTIVPVYAASTIPAVVPVMKLCVVL